MALRPAKCYRRIERPYTRQSRRKPRKGYVKGVPESKIHRFEMGDGKSKFDVTMSLVSKNHVQIRHNALEAARIAVNKHLDLKLGKINYFCKILVFPHHVLRENPLATGAGADRFQTGMRLSFGKPIGTAAQVKAGQPIIRIKVYRGQEEVAKRALKIASSKMPTPCSIVTETARFSAA